jgi:hypothetical protein
MIFPPPFFDENCSRIYNMLVAMEHGSKSISATGGWYDVKFIMQRSGVRGNMAILCLDKLLAIGKIEMRLRREGASDRYRLYRTIDSKKYYARIAD